MKIIKRIFLTGLGILTALVVISFFLPQQIKVERSIAIKAPAQKIYPLINDLQQFNTWSPWAQKDPDTQYRMEGPKSGVGSKMFWTSDHPQVGSGNQQIIENIENEFVKTRLDFGAQGVANAYFYLSPEADSTRVIWGFTTDLGLNPIGRYMGLFFDSWIGADYEEGLANLKKTVEVN